MIDICICTHNPRWDVLRIALAAVAKQDASDHCRVLLVDNASEPAIDAKVLQSLLEAGIEARLVVEPELGIARARHRAISETDDEWILFVDDDNEVAADYISAGRQFIAENPDVGCFGGKLLLPDGLSPPGWATPFRPFLGIRDFGDAPIIETRDEWGPWEPPTAGAWVRRDVAERYARTAAANEGLFSLGRAGAFDLASCEDSLMMRGAAQLGLASAYAPSLRLFHHLAEHRFSYEYLLPLMAAYGRSQILLEDVLGREHPMAAAYADPGQFKSIVEAALHDKGSPVRFRAAPVTAAKAPGLRQSSAFR